MSFGFTTRCDTNLSVRSFPDDQVAMKKIRGSSLWLFGGGWWLRRNSRWRKCRLHRLVGSVRRHMMVTTGIIPMLLLTSKMTLWRWKMLIGSLRWHYRRRRRSICWSLPWRRLMMVLRRRRSMVVVIRSTSTTSTTRMLVLLLLMVVSRRWSTTACSSSPRRMATGWW